MSPAWMPLYIADYRLDTARLSAAEHGAYLLLIMEYWAAGSLPDDDRQLARIACMTDREWKKARPIVATFFQDGWKHKRIEEELAKAAATISKRRAAAEQMHDGRRAKARANAHADALADAHASKHAGHLIRAVPPSPPPKGSEASASGGERPGQLPVVKPEPTDPTERLWHLGVPALTAMGLSEREARSNIGRWQRDTGNDSGRVLAAIHRARDHSSGDPIALIGRILQPISRQGKNHGPSRTDVARALADWVDEDG